MRRTGASIGLMPDNQIPLSFPVLPGPVEFENILVCFTGGHGLLKVIAVAGMDIYAPVLL
jgi:hypothetical protein